MTSLNGLVCIALYDFRRRDKDKHLLKTAFILSFGVVIAIIEKKPVYETIPLLFVLWIHRKEFKEMMTEHR